MKKIIPLVTTVFICCLLLAACVPSSATVVISEKNMGVAVSDDLYGLFIEDISFACDGGLVSNLVSNTGFDYEADPFFNWNVSGLDCAVETAEKMNDKNGHYLRVTSSGEGALLNKGYVEYYEYLTKKFKKGLSDVPDMGFKKGVDYRFCCYLKNIDFVGEIILSLTHCPEKTTKLNFAQTADWQKATATLPSDRTGDGGLLITLKGTGTILMDSFELVAGDSYGYDDPKWKYVSLRADLYNALKELSPSFVRFPGGCLAEGTSLENLYNWKETIGELNERKHYVNIWNDDENGLAYDNTNAMGYHEYFQLAEDLGAKALPILNAGTICQFQMKKDGKDYKEWEKDHREGKISDEKWNEYLDLFALRPGTVAFDAYVRDILDLIEYANGDKTTVWGAKRAENGHEQPFGLRYIGIGNENWGDLYWRNFSAIYNVLKEKAPDVTVISSAGPFFDGSEKEEAYRIIDEKYLDTVVDEHYYLDNEKMFKNTDYYDDYPRDRQVFVGEYAATCKFFGKYITKNNIWAAIEEAGYMCGFERNGDVVKMASYAPTFAKINSQRWNINLIWFDSQNIVLTPNYFTQMLFSNNVGTRYIDTDLSIDGVETSATVDEEKKVVYYKVVNKNKKGFDLTINVDGFGKVNASTMQYLSDKSKAACNELGSTTVVPKEVVCAVENGSVKAKIEGQSINVIRVLYGENDGSEVYRLPDLPSTMEQDVTVYKKPYLTVGGLVAIVVPCGTILLAFCGFFLFKAIKKIKKRK